jgi:hypothetical protein
VDYADPVVLFVHPASPLLTTVEKRITKEAVPATLKWAVPAAGLAYDIDAPDAVRLLEMCCGTAGRVVADKMASDRNVYLYREVFLQPHRIEIYGYQDGKQSLCAVEYFKPLNLPGPRKLAAKLASQVSSGEVRCRREPPRKLTDDLLSEGLQEVFLDKPDVVAEAIRILRQAPGNKGRKLLRVLKRPELEFLRREVEKALARG